MKVICMIFFMTFSLYAKELPSNIQAAIMIKILKFNKDIKGDVKVYVLDNSDFAKAIEKVKGKKLGNFIIKEVHSGSDLPKNKPDVIYCSNPNQIDKVKQFCRQQKVLSMSGNGSMVEAGLTIGIVLGDDSKPKILLNTNASKAEAIKWNPAILKFSRVIR